MCVAVTIQFIRTTEPRHRDAVYAVWQRLVDAGYIYLGQHEGWYCKADECFVPDTQLKTVEQVQGLVRVVKHAG